MAKLSHKTHAALAARTALAASLLSLGAAGAAQMTDTEDSWDAAPTTFDHFTTADASGDGLLDAGEYESFLSAIASSGDMDAQTLIEAGEVDVAFVNADIDGDSLVSYGEVHMSMEPESETGADMAEPVPAPEDYPASHSDTDDMGHNAKDLSAEPDPEPEL